MPSSTFTQKVQANFPITELLAKHFAANPYPQMEAPQMGAKPMLPKLDQHNAQYNIRRVSKWMGKVNIPMLGSGFFSRVFAHPTDPTKVIKYGPLSDGPLSDGWLVYAAWVKAQRGTSNPHLPVIHSIRHYEKHGVYCAVLERLEMTVCQARRKAMDEMRYQDADVWLGWRTVKEMLSNGSAQVNKTDWDALLTKLNASDTLTRTLDRLSTFARRHGLGCDLHEENAMLRRRPDGGFDLVITDPFSYYYYNGHDKQAAIRAAQQATTIAA